jgi:hypothetical protein
LRSRSGLAAEDRLRRAYDLYAAGENHDETVAAHRLRFVRLAKTVILAHSLEETGAPSIRSRFERLRAAESRNLSSRHRALKMPPRRRTVGCEREAERRDNFARGWDH